MPARSPPPSSCARQERISIGSRRIFCFASSDLRHPSQICAVRLRLLYAVTISALRPRHFCAGQDCRSLHRRCRRCFCAGGCHCGQSHGDLDYLQQVSASAAQDLRQLIHVGLLSAAAPLVCLVSLISIGFNIATNAIVVNITLDGQNYPEWAFCVETALRGHGLLFHLTDAAPVLADDRRNAADIKTWQLNDGKVMAAMVNSVKPSMIMSLSKFKTAKAIWSHLKERFVQDSGALLHTLMQQTHVIEQNDMSIDEYYSAFDRLMSALTSMVPACTADPCPAHKFIEKFFTYRFVMGVRAEFDSLRARLLQGSDTLTMAKALSDLLAEETRLNSLSSTGGNTHSVLATAQKP